MRSLRTTAAAAVLAAGSVLLLLFGVSLTRHQNNESSVLRVSRNLLESAHRRLQGSGPGMQQIFNPLECNAPENMAKICQLWTPDTVENDLVIIPCGQCFILDAFNDEDTVPGMMEQPDIPTFEFKKGLDIQGRLEIVPDTKAVIKTPFILVQGELDLQIPDGGEMIQGQPNIRIVLTDHTAVTGAPTTLLNVGSYVHDDNAHVCAHTITSPHCKMGKKAIVVAGGKVNINAIHPTCPAWTYLQDLAPSRANANPLIYPTPFQPPKHCPRQGILHYDFTKEDKSDERWRAAKSTTFGRTADSTFRVSNRSATNHGPIKVFAWFYEYTEHCIKPNHTYYLTLRYRLIKHDDPTWDGPTTCARNGRFCLFINFRHMNQEGKWRWRMLARETSALAGRYGQWHTLVQPVSFSKDDVEMGERILIFGPEPGFDIEIDFLDLSLPSIGSYPDPDGEEGVCGDLIPANGGADAAGLTTLPMYGGWDRPLVIEQEDDGMGGTNSFFRILARGYTRHSMAVDMIPGCIQFGAIYDFTVRLRIHSDVNVHAVVELQTQEDDEAGEWTMPPVGEVVTCPKQNKNSGWVTCAGTYHFPLRGYGSITNGSSPRTKYRVIFNIAGDQRSIVDYDDIFFKYREGAGDMSNKIILPEGVTKCWGEGSEVLFTSFTENWTGSQVRKITNVETVDDGDMALLTLDRPIVNPKTVEGDGPDHATEVALLSRNVRLEPQLDNDTLLQRHGGHFMVLATPDIPQVVDGLEIRGFGQQGHLDRYPIHFHMCKSVSGSVIRNNLIRDSLQRGVVIKGTHNVTVEENVAYNTHGHCFVLEDGAEEDNSFVRNLGALTKAIPTENMIGPDETDDEPATFYITNPMNRWSSNVAAGSEHAGYSLMLDEHIHGESSHLLENQDIDPALLPLQSFKNNVAHSNKVAGFQHFPAETAANSHEYMNGDSGGGVERL